MYYIETLKSDGYHKYIASMTGSVVKGQEVDEGAYQFENAGDCDRAVKVINKVYGLNGIVARRKTIGKENKQETREPIQTVAKKEPKLSQQAKTKEAVKMALIQKLLNKPPIPPQNPGNNTEGTAPNQPKDIALSTIVKATVNKNKKPMKQMPPKEIKNKSFFNNAQKIGEEIDLDDVGNIGMEQYVLDESGGDF